MRVAIEVPDGSHLQLLADALAEAADMRTRAAGRAARDVQSDTTITDKRPDASRLLAVVADADWIRSVAEALPLLVVDDAGPAPTTPAPANGAAAIAAELAAPPPVPLAERVRAAGRQFELDPAAQARLRALTVPPGARLTPTSPPATVDGPPPALLAEAEARAAAEQSLDDLSIFGGDDGP